MITDDLTNFVYVSALLEKKHPVFFNNLISEFRLSNVTSDVLPDTRDIWAVDYMPIQLSKNRFISFTYRPDYLINFKTYQNRITDADLVCSKIAISAEKSDILIDGGNVIKGKSFVIMTNKIFIENSQYSEKLLLKMLEEMFEVKVIIIPAFPKEYTGHADGLVRYFSEDTVLINNFSKETKQEHVEFAVNLRKVLRNAGLNYREVPYQPDYSKSSDAIGLYLNYLHMKDFVLVPTFGIQSDDNAVKHFEELFKGSDVRFIRAEDIARNGGVLNCITWNILK